MVEQLNSRYPEGFNVPQMAKLAGMSASNFRHRFSEVMGVSPVEYLTRLRLKMAAPLLTTPENITNIAFRVGFEDNLYLSKGVLAKSNGELVKKVADLAALLGRPVATPAEARGILGLRK